MKMEKCIEVCTKCLHGECTADEMKVIRRASISRLGTCQFCCTTRTLYDVPVSLLPDAIKTAADIS